MELSLSSATVFSLNAVFRFLVVPLYERLRANRRRSAYVVFYYAAFLRRGNNVDFGLSAAAYYMAVACCKYCATEGVVAKTVLVESKNVVGIDVNVVPEIL